jgi:tRNA threonylcarbamoyladenosine biosynthesis protein TsaE
MHADDDNPEHFTLPDEVATLAFGAALGAGLAPGLLVTLEGDLGAGKTCLVRGLLRGLGHLGPVKSPTYTLVELYVVSGLNLYHFDFYRFNTPEEYLDAGLDEYFGGNGVCLVEWPDRAVPYLPAPDLRIRLSIVGGDPAGGRLAELSALSAAGRQCLTNSLSCLRAATSSSSPPPA